MIELCNTKQKIGEPFLTFLQRWRKIFSRYSQRIPDSEKMDIFINNLIPKLKYSIQMQVYPSFKKMVDSTLRMEGLLIRNEISHFGKKHNKVLVPKKRTNIGNMAKITTETLLMMEW